MESKLEQYLTELSYYKLNFRGAVEKIEKDVTSSMRDEKK